MPNDKTIVGGVDFFNTSFSETDADKCVLTTVTEDGTYGLESWLSG